MQTQSEDTPEVGVRVRVEKDLRLDHVVGQDEAIKRLKGLVNRIKYSSVYDLWGIEKPKALALTGPPGVGKTFSIRALANEVECPLLELCYEDISSHLLDESIRRLASLKSQVEELAAREGHVLILIDEADSFFQSRFDTHAHPADKKKTNFFLRWIDGDLEGSSNFTLIATSNAWETVDPALRRPGRFLEIKYEALSTEDIKKALRIHMDLAEKSASRKLFEEFNMSEFNLPDGITGADVKEIVSIACLVKANAFLDQYRDDEEGSLDPSDEYLITHDELYKIASDYAAKLNLDRKRAVGFGRN